METAYVVGNWVGNGVLIIIVGFMIRRWMNTTESTARANRLEAQQDSNEIKKSLDDLTDQVRTQNGNVARVSEEIHIQAALCKLRTEGRRTLDKCGDV